MQSRPLPVLSGDAGGEGRVSEVVAAVVAKARRRAVRDGDQQIDTAYLLHGLLESDPDVRDAFPGGSPQVARLLGYLAQRPIGYGLGWSGTVEDSGAVPAVRSGVAGWSPAAGAALEAAVRWAASRGAYHAGALDLLAALLCDPECRAVEVLRRAGVTVEPLVTALTGGVCQQSTG